MIVDAHVHVHAINSPRYPYAPLSGGLPGYFPSRTMTFEQLTETMPAAGVDKAALVQFAGIHGIVDNSYVIDSAAKARDRFAAVCSLDTHASDIAAQTRDWVARGAAGLRVVSHALDQPPEHVRAPAVWEVAQELNIPLKTHLTRGMHASVGLPWVTDMMARHSKVRVVLDNVGNVPWRPAAPFGLEPVLALAHANIVLLVTGVCFDRWSEAGAEPAAVFRLLVDNFGADRIMWGSDAPNSPGSYQSLVRRQRDAIAGLSSTEQDWILGRTALTVYPQLV